MHGRRLIELCQSTSFILGNGRLHNDRGIGDYTFHSRIGSSTVDYVLLYSPDIKYITKFEIEEITEFSDHCGISFSVQCNEEELSDSNNNVNPQTMYIVFDETKVDRFIQDLSLKNESFSLLTNELEPWFNAKCYSSRKQFTKTRNAFNRDRSNATLRNEFLTAKAIYKRIQRQSKSKYQTKENINMTNLCKTNPRQSWKKIKEQYAKNERIAENLNVSDLNGHFKNLYSKH